MRAHVTGNDCVELQDAETVRCALTQAIQNELLADALSTALSRHSEACVGNMPTASHIVRMKDVEPQNPSGIGFLRNGAVRLRGKELGSLLGAERIGLGKGRSAPDHLVPHLPHRRRIPCPAMAASWRDGKFYADYPIGPTRCDATVGGVGGVAYMRLREVMDDLIVVSEDEAASACAFMAREEKLVAEVASCMTVAAVRNHREQVGGNRVALVISGGNIDGAVLDEVLHRY